MPISRDFFRWVATTLRWVLGPGASPPPAPVRRMRLPVG